MAATLTTYYDVLRVERTASAAGIRQAYRRLAQQYHPDKMPGNANAQRAMAAINAAYEVLSDAHQRAEHDRWIRQAESRPAPLQRSEPPSRWSLAWPWYLLFATISIAVAALFTTAYVMVVPARAAPAIHKTSVTKPAPPSPARAPGALPPATPA